MRVAHLSDTHLGYRAFARTHRNINQREWDVLSTFRDVLIDIARWKPDLVIHTGDLFDRPHPGRFTLINTVRMLKQFAATGIPMVILSGNHDTTRSLSDAHIFSLLQEALPPSVHLVYGQAQCLFLHTASGPVEVLAVPAELLSTLPQGQSLHPQHTDCYRIAMLHGISPRLPALFHYGPWVVPEDLIDESEWSYVAWGDYHDLLQLSSNAFYAGATDYASSNVWSERAPKGWLKVYLTRRQCRVQHCPSRPRPHITIPVDDQVPPIPDVQQAVVRVVFRQPEHAEQLKPILQQQLAQACMVQWVRQRASSSAKSAVEVPVAVPLEERWRQFVMQQPRPELVPAEEWEELRRCVIDRGIEALQRS